MKLSGKLSLIGLAVALALLAAVSVPSLIEDRIGFAEASAIGSLRSIGAAQLRHREREGRYADLAELGRAGDIADDLSSGTKHGYRFAIRVASETWTASAEPIEPGESGERRFFIDATRVVRYEADRPATAASPALPRWAP